VALVVRLEAAEEAPLPHRWFFKYRVSLQVGVVEAGGLLVALAGDDQAEALLPRLRVQAALLATPEGIALPTPVCQAFLVALVVAP
jgi:hypothetical protein